MSKTIEIHYTWSKELALEASKRFYDYDMRNSAKRYIGWLFVALTQFAIVGALKHDSYTMLYLCSFLVAYWYYGRWYLRKSMLEKYYKKIDAPEKEVTFSLKDNIFYSEDTPIDWDDIFKVIQLEDGVLLHTKENTLFFSRNSFSSYEELQAFMQVMKEHNKL